MTMMDTKACLSTLKEICFKYNYPIPTLLLDCGASDGSWTRDFQALFPYCHCHLIEANPIFQKRLNDYINYETSETDVTIAAVSNKDGEEYFNFGTDDPYGGGLTHTPKGTLVKTITLKTLCEKHVKEYEQATMLVKMDLHSGEVKALEGLGDIKPDFLFIECYFRKLNDETLRFWELTSELEKNGYLPLMICELSNRLLDSTGWQFDGLWAKDNFPAFLNNNYK